MVEGSAALLAYAVCTVLCPQAAQGIKNAAESIYDQGHETCLAVSGLERVPYFLRSVRFRLESSPAGHSAQSSGYSPPSVRHQWDPIHCAAVTGKERIRIDPGHVDKTTGKPFDNPNAAQPHVHGYDPAGQKIRDPATGDPHFPLKPSEPPQEQSPCQRATGCN